MALDKVYEMFVDTKITAAIKACAGQRTYYTSNEVEPEWTARQRAKYDAVLDLLWKAQQAARDIFTD